MKPPLVSFYNFQDIRNALILGRDINQQELLLFDELVSKNIPPLVNTNILPIIFGVSHKLISAIEHDQGTYYREFKIKKKDGGYRTINTPRVFLRVIHWWINENILYKRLNLLSNIHGFIPGRSSFTNANNHIGKKYLLNLDIQDFFPSIKIDQVIDVYSLFLFPPKVVKQLARISTLDNQLPQGAPTSPALSNLVFEPIDIEINDICQAMGMTYSRYADDLSFSSNVSLGSEFLYMISTILERNRFYINIKKTRFMKPGQRRIVTGFVINEKIQPARKLRRQLRAIFHQASLSPEKYKDDIRKLSGWASYVNTYDLKKGKEYLSIVKKMAK